MQETTPQLKESLATSVSYVLDYLYSVTRQWAFFDCQTEMHALLVYDIKRSALTSV